MQHGNIPNTHVLHIAARIWGNIDIHKHEIVKLYVQPAINRQRKCLGTLDSKYMEKVLTLYVLNVNPLCAKFFRGYININIYLHFMSFLYIDLTQVLKILPQVREWPIRSYGSHTRKQNRTSRKIPKWENTPFECTHTLSVLIRIFDCALRFTQMIFLRLIKTDSHAIWINNAGSKNLSKWLRNFVFHGLEQRNPIES